MKKMQLKMKKDLVPQKFPIPEIVCCQSPLWHEKNWGEGVSLQEKTLMFKLHWTPHSIWHPEENKVLFMYMATQLTLGDSQRFTKIKLMVPCGLITSSLVRTSCLLKASLLIEYQCSLTWKSLFLKILDFWKPRGRLFIQHQPLSSNSTL